MPWQCRGSIVCRQSYSRGTSALWGGQAVAEIIAGITNPSGKLPFTIARRLEDYPAHSFGERAYPGIDGTVHYDESIFIGYRWNDSKKIKPQFAFGHGLSYTRFEYVGLTADRKSYAPGDTIHLSLEVKNIGVIDGAETVQFYVSQSKPKLVRPLKRA